MRKAAAASSSRRQRRTEGCGGILACLEDNKMSRTTTTTKKSAALQQESGHYEQCCNTKSSSESSFSSPPVKNVAFSAKLSSSDKDQQQQQQAFLDLSPFTASSASASSEDEEDESDESSSSSSETEDDEEDESDEDEEELSCESESIEDRDDDSSSDSVEEKDEQDEKEAEESGSDDDDDDTTLSAVTGPLTGSTHASGRKEKRRQPANKRGNANGKRITAVVASKEMDDEEDFEQVCQQLQHEIDDDEYNPDCETDASAEASHDDQDDDDVLEFDDEEDSLVERRLAMARKKKEEEIASAASSGSNENVAVAMVLNGNDDHCESDEVLADPFDEDGEENGSSGGVNGSIIEDQAQSTAAAANNNSTPSTKFSREIEKMTRGLDRCDLSDNDSSSNASMESHGETGNNSSFFADQTIDAGADLCDEDDEQRSFHGAADSCRSSVNADQTTVEQACPMVSKCTVIVEATDKKVQGPSLLSTLDSRNTDNVEDMMGSTASHEHCCLQQEDDAVTAVVHHNDKKVDPLCATRKSSLGATQQSFGKFVNGDGKTATVKDKVSAVNQQISKKKSPPSTGLVSKPKSSSNLKPKGRSLHRSRSEGIIKPGRWALGSKIGSGAFGVVHIGMNTQTGTLMAVKSFEMDRAVMKDIRREIYLLKSLEHPNIVRYYGAEMDKNKLCIFQEWVPAGSVTELLARFGPFTLSVIRSYLSQTLSGLSYLHSQDIMHRDIKGSNILVSDEGVVKLADFGASKKLAELQSGKMMSLTVQGTPYFMAPEVFEGKYSVKADIWAVGCLAYQMAAGFPPWKNLGFTNPFALSTFVQKQTKPPTLVLNCPDSLQTDQASIFLRNLVEKCCNYVPQDRPDASILLDEPFLVSNDLSSSKSDDEQSTDHRGLFSPESHGTASYWESPHSRHDSGILHSPIPQKSNASRDRTHNRSSSIGPTSCRSVLCSPPVPNQQSGTKQHLQTNTTLMQISPTPPCFSPKVDPSSWPSWARKKYEESGADLECSKNLEKENETSDSLVFSAESSAFQLQPNGVSTDVSCLLHGEKFLPPSSSKP